MAKDLIIGVVDNYNFSHIKNWVNSIDASGFTGIRALIAYNMDHKTVSELTQLGVIVYAFKEDDNKNLIYPIGDRSAFNVVVERFVHLWHFIGKIKDDIEYVITTDVRDVVFQTNPSEMIRSLLNDGQHDLLVGSENFLYKDEPWNVANMNLSFGPMLFHHLQNTPIYCAGVLGGKPQALIDLCLNVFLLCRGGPAYVAGGGGPDQAALNILLKMEKYSQSTVFAKPSDNIIVHLGTTLPAILSGFGEIGHRYKRNPQLLDEYKKSMLYSETYIDDNGMVCNGNKEPYCIVHQYDRITGLKEKIDLRFDH